MSASEIERTLVRLAHEIVEKSNGSEDLALVGIKRRGVPLAQRLGKLISGIEKHPVDTGVLDIQFYRDDLSTAGVRPVVTPGAIGFDIEGRDVVHLRRRALHRPHHPRRARRALRPWPPAPRATGRAHRPRPSRVAHRSHLCRANMFPPAAARLSKSSSRKSTQLSRCCWSSRPARVHPSSRGLWPQRV